MSVERGRPAQVRRRTNIETVVGFDPQAVQAPFILRCGAAAIDYILVVLCPVGFLLLSRVVGHDGAALLNSELNNIGWLLGILVALSNLVALPAVSGKTVGKMVTGLTIVDKSGRPAGFNKILIRQLLGGLVTILTLGLSFFISALLPGGRAIHDLIAGTVVIYGEKRAKSVPARSNYGETDLQ